MEGLRVAPVGHKDFNVVYKRAVQEFLIMANPEYVVYSAGVSQLDWLEDTGYASWQRQMDVNVWGFVQVCQALHEMGTKPRSIVAVTSDAAWRPMRTSLAYCASKAALDMTVKVVARETADLGWRVNAVAPGKVEGTPMTKYVDERVLHLRGWTEAEAEAKELASSALGRKVAVNEVAAVIRDVLLSPVLAFTGAVVPVNGGR